MAALLGSIAGWVKSLAGGEEASAPGAPAPTSNSATESAAPVPTAAGGSTAPASTTPHGAAATSSVATALPAMLPIKIIFATTTGTSQRFADVIRREAFAMHVSGFHFSVTAVAAANYPMDDIEKETAVVLFLMPTWTGGSPPASGKLLCDHVRDLATDFRVSKDALAKLRYAVFGLGCREYGRNFCRAALELDEQVASLGGARLAACGTGDDQTDLDEAFAAWRAGLWPTLCELFAKECGEPAAGAAGAGGGAAAAAASGCGDGCGSSGSAAAADSSSSFAAYRKPAGGVFTEAGDEEYADDDDDDDADDGGHDGAGAGSGGECCGGKASGSAATGCCKDSSASSGAAAGSCGCSSGSGSAAAPAAAPSTAADASTASASAVAASAGPSAFLPLREYRKLRRNLPPAERAAFDATRRAMALAAKGISAPLKGSAASGAASDAASLATGGAGGGGDDGTVRTGAASDDDEDEDEDAAAALGAGELEEDEEDRLNAELLAAADGDGIDDPSSSAGAAAAAARHPADSDDEGETVAAARAAARTAGAASRSAAGAGAAARTAAAPLSAAERIMEAEGELPASGAGAGAKGGAGASAAGVGLADVEDLAAMLAAGKAGSSPAPAAASSAAADAAGSADAAAAAAAAAGPREMVTPMQRRALVKEGYKLIGSHSAVKICRWTKSMLRGRGGCYKYSFYAIRSYLCMEVTPSLACANKCVFCWRHHKNPVGTSWRWKVDDPVAIVEQAIAKHAREIKALKGLPGINMDRWREAHMPRHCALSLVGEPIMYPHIGTLLRELHKRAISSFLVTNAQFPEAFAGLPPVTQLYVSIDAATKETLKAIDRPLFKDFWERFLASLDALRDRRQRTVYRLTLVKSKSAGIADGSAPADAPDDGNMGQLEEYAALVARGQPDFIEIKGVTWCGTSPGSTLTMANVPWHHEVKAFCEALAARVGGTYGLAAEHAHSCCVLVARKDPFLRDGVWHTQIDYARFFELFARWEATGEAFTSADYMAPTAPWAAYGCEAAGFDPEEVRHYRRKDGSVAALEYKTSESGCG